MQDLFQSETHRVFRNQNGGIDTVLTGERMVLETSVGKMIPRYTVDDESRKKEAPVKFYRTGELKSLPLEEATEIVTSLGMIKAELLTFYQNGALRRLFPLNGKITGYWTEENEYTLAETLEIPTPIGPLSVKPIYLQFFENGELESVGFWPKERVSINSSVGKVKIRKGISFYRNGNLRGFEPAQEIQVESPIGLIKVFDPDPQGLHAESNAVDFYENGEIKSLTTSSTQVSVEIDKGEKEIFAPTLVSSYCNESAFFVSPMKIQFAADSVSFQSSDNPGKALLLSSRFETSDFIPEKPIAGIACEE